MKKKEVYMHVYERERERERERETLCAFLRNPCDCCFVAIESSFIGTFVLSFIATHNHTCVLVYLMYIVSWLLSKFELILVSSARGNVKFRFTS